ncbi:MAG: hypothetical protein FJ009_04525 [Chloroflexi bacterium]|nr:hypothetical protein [Chloroflexota bacterium]
MRPIVFVLAGLALIGWMTLSGSPGVVDPLDVQDRLAQPAGQLRDARTVGQTFVAHSSRLSAIQVCWVASDDFSFAPSSRVTFHLRARADDPTDLVTVAFPLTQVRHNECSSFRFFPQSDSAARAYYFFLDAASAEITRGWFSVWASDDDVLSEGRAHAAHLPTNYDLAFRAYSASDLFAACDTVRQALARQPGIFLVVGLMCALAGLVSFRTQREISGASMQGFSSRHTLVAMTLLAALALLTVALGILQFAELPAPLWVDSVNHAADIQEILTRGHAPLDRIYHFGFHGIVALLIQVSGMAIAPAIILIGQLIVVQIGLSFFAFGKRWTGSDLVGLVSAIAVWFLTPTPMYFLTWGRYPLLLGAAILPLALIAALDWFDAPRFNARALLLVVVTLAALAFAHLRLLAFYFVFLALYCAWQRAHTRRLLALALLVVPAGIAWSVLLLSQPDGAQNASATLAFWSGIDLATTFEILRSHYGAIAWTLAALGLGVAFARRNARALFVVAWFSALVVLAAIATWLGAPLLEVPFVLLMGFFPAAFLIGELARVVREKMRATKFLAPLEMTLGLLVVLLGAREMLTIVNPTTILFTRADERAMTWIAANTPDDARLLVNAFAWYPTIYVPSDGGAWIPYFTRRAIVIAHPTARSDAQANYVYLGRRAGILRARDFADARRYELVYEEEEIRIWKIQPSQ